MKELLNSTKEFKIIPVNFKSAGMIKIINISDNTFKAELILSSNEEIKDYIASEQVEVFGVNNAGLVYFETNIIKVENGIVELALVDDYSIIQRREYSRVGFQSGKIIFKDLPNNIVKEVKNISAGGVKFLSNYSFESDKTYEITIILSSNMKIECKFQPIRIIAYKGEKLVSGRFLDLENMDRIVLVQYAFKVKMEEQNQIENN